MFFLDLFFFPFIQGRLRAPKNLDSSWRFCALDHAGLESGTQFFQTSYSMSLVGTMLLYFLFRIKHKKEIFQNYDVTNFYLPSKEKPQNMIRKIFAKLQGIFWQLVFQVSDQSNYSVLAITLQLEVIENDLTKFQAWEYTDLICFSVLPSTIHNYFHTYDKQPIK